MKTPSQLRKRSLCGAWILILLVAAGCRQRVEGVFAMVDLRDIHRMAVLGLSPEHEQIFMANYINLFREQDLTFVERTAVHEILREQDIFRDDPATALDEGRLNEDTRARIRQVLGVEALALCQYYQTPQLGTWKFRVRIVNTETGGIVASAITVGPDHFQYHSTVAVKKIREALMREYRRTYNGGS